MIIIIIIIIIITIIIIIITVVVVVINYYFSTCTRKISFTKQCLKLSTELAVIKIDNPS